MNSFLLNPPVINPPVINPPVIATGLTAVMTILLIISTVILTASKTPEISLITSSSSSISLLATLASIVIFFPTILPKKINNSNVVQETRKIVQDSGIEEEIENSLTCPEENRPPCGSGYKVKKNLSGEDCCYKIISNDNNAGDIAKGVLIGVALSPTGILLALKGSKVLTRSINKAVKKTIVRKMIRRTVLVSKFSSGLVRPKFMGKMAKIVGKPLSKIASFTSKKAINGAVIAAKAGTKVAKLNPATIVFEALSLVLDLTDAGGYNELQYLKSLDAIKKDADKEFKEQVENNGEYYPPTVSPLDQIDPETIRKQMNKSIIKVIQEKYLEEIISKNKDEMKGKSEKEIGSILDRELSKLDERDWLNISEQAFDDTCIQAGGINRNKGCSYKSKKDCHSYKWPLDKNSSEDEFLNVRRWVKGECIMEDPTLRITCDAANLPFDYETGLCKVSREYCKSKGADYKYDKDLNMYDCFVDDTQNAFEFIFGKTIVRGLKQVFDTRQYESCKSGEIDDVYSCRTKKCKPGDESTGADQLCYPKCPSGYSGVGPVCWKKCKSGYTDDGALCRKDAHIFGKSTYGRGAGKIPNFTCPSSHPYKRGIGAASWCDNGGFWNFETRNSNKSCGSGSEMYAGLCYSKCKSGFENVGCCICRKKGCPSGYKDDGATCRRDVHIYGKETKRRGVGYIPETNVRFKKRKINYSTK